MRPSLLLGLVQRRSARPSRSPGARRTRPRRAASSTRGSSSTRTDDRCVLGQPAQHVDLEDAAPAGSRRAAAGAARPRAGRAGRTSPRCRVGSARDARRGRRSRRPRPAARTVSRALGAAAGRRGAARRTRRQSLGRRSRWCSRWRTSASTPSMSTTATIGASDSITGPSAGRADCPRLTPTRVRTATVEPARPLSTCTWVGIRVRSSVTWLTTPTVRPPARSAVDAVHHVVEGVGVEHAEALVDEQRVDLGAAGLLGDHVGQAERERQRHHEGLAAGQRRRVAGLAGPWSRTSRPSPAWLPRLAARPVRCRR